MVGLVSIKGSLYGQPLLAAPSARFSFVHLHSLQNSIYKKNKVLFISNKVWTHDPPLITPSTTIMPIHFWW